MKYILTLILSSIPLIRCSRMNLKSSSKPYVKCEKCWDRDIIMCPDCKGVKEKECSKCDGQGSVPNLSGGMNINWNGKGIGFNSNYRCKPCEGTGKVPMNCIRRCNNGTILCPYCPHRNK